MRDNGCANVRRSYLLDPVQDAVVKSVAKANGSSSESAALRFIIEDWWRSKGAGVKPDPVLEPLGTMRTT